MTPTIHVDIGVTDSRSFLRLWLAWRANAQRPRMLHVVALCKDLYANELISARESQDLKPLAELLNAQLWGLLPGFHRLVFEGGHVLLTLCIGDVVKLLRQQQFEADSITLNSAALADSELLFAIKAISRLCKPSTLLTTADTPSMRLALRQCGFECNQRLGELNAKHHPPSVTKKPRASIQPGRCVVVGAGLSGAAVANSLARRGWAVTVVDVASAPACGASGLPAGLLVPHTSADDSSLSRLSRVGVRMTLQHARGMLHQGFDWCQTGVLQRDFSGTSLKLRRDQTQTQRLATSDWCSQATAETLSKAGLTPDTAALWHKHAGWIKPAALVHAWLTAPGITWLGDAKVAQLRPSEEGWQLMDGDGQALASASLVVLAAGHASQALAVSAGAVQPDLQAIRGQVTLGFHADSSSLPPFSVNGHGSLITDIPTPEGRMWLMGAGYERDVTTPDIKTQDHDDNLTRLKTLLPSAAGDLSRQFSPAQARGWAGIRCATPNRLPRVAPLATVSSTSGLWICAGMGSRGLSFAALCGELLAAQLHGEPLPIDIKLAAALKPKATAN